VGTQIFKNSGKQNQNLKIQSGEFLGGLLETYFPGWVRGHPPLQTPFVAARDPRNVFVAVC